jgi:hypothetical protein
MTLTVEEIDRWDAAAIRVVADAARSRATAACDAAGGLGALPCWSSWGGRSAVAARDAIARARRDLEAHVTEARAVADAADRAADSIEQIAADLRYLRIEAALLGLQIDASTNRITPIPGSVLPAVLPLIARPVLQIRLNAIVRQANSVDAELAAALGSDNPLAPARTRTTNLPDDAAQFHALWRSLSRQQRDELYRRDRGVGNHPGMPVGTDSDPGSDYYNRRHLAEALASARDSDGEHLPDLEALDESLRDHPDHRLMLYDTGGEQVHAAIAVGDPDTATHVCVTAPGLNTTVRASMREMVSEAGALRRESLRQLADADRPGEGVAAVAWIGYDIPQIEGPELVKVDAGLPLLGVGLPLVPGLVLNPLSLARSELGAYRVTHDAAAKAGAVNLARFYDGITAAHGGAPLNLTAIGHSYGSLTTGLALPQSRGVSNAIFYGSPGVEAATPAQLGLPPGQVFVMQTPDDIIRWRNHAPAILRAAAVAIPGPFDDVALRISDLTGTGDFGPDPATNPNFVRLETGPAVVIDGAGGALRFDGASGHSEYPEIGSTTDPGGGPLLRTPGYNIAAVVAGLSERAIRGD